MPFTPKFVDLVRNTTTTTGTGNFVLGPAVNGFASFTSACQVGDTFYYSAIGIDKPAEREVGRGTLLAGGAVSREPISGTKTDFTGGTKSLALIAAAEWFNTVQLASAGGPAASLSVATRAALAANVAQQPLFLTERDCEGLFVWDGSNLASRVSADTRLAVYVPPASDPSGASGAWVRRREGSTLHIDWFGAAGDGVTDDTAAFVALRTLCIALRSGEAVGPRSAPEVRLGKKTYLLASSFDWKGCTNIWRGAGPGANQFPTGSVIKMASGCTFHLNADTTEGGTTGTAISNLGCNGTEFHNIAFRGPGKGVGTAPIVWMRARCQFYNCTFTEGGSHGLQIKATAGGGTTAEGNANCWLMVGGACSNNGGSGLYTNGADANAGTAIGTSFDHSARYGVEEESFLGNNYYGCHWDANTLGHVHGTNPNNTSRFGDYFESGYPISVIPPRSHAYGVNCSSQIDGAFISANDALGSGKSVFALNGLQLLKSAGGKTLNFISGAQPDTAPGEAWRYTDFCNGTNKPYSRRFRPNTDILVEEFGMGGSLWLSALNGDGTGTALPRHNFGRTTPPAGVRGFTAFALGYENFNPDGKIIGYASAVPTSGDVGKGEFRFNDCSTNTKAWGWWCNADDVANNGGTWDTIYRRLYGSATWDPGSVASGAQVTTTVSVTGAALGDIATASFSSSLSGLQMSAYVSAAATVTIVLSNLSGGAVDLASGTVRVEVVKQ